MNNKFLYEIMESYKDETSEENRIKIFKDFCSAIWQCNNKRRVYNKAIKFKVKEELLNTYVGNVFDKYSYVEYKTYKSNSNENDWCSLIRQKINNLYTNYFDDEVILKKDYMDKIKTPKTLYYRWLQGNEFDEKELEHTIEISLDKAKEIRERYAKRKRAIKISWHDYKKEIEIMLKKIFDNFILIDEYEVINNSRKISLYDSLEDNFYIKYICKSLEGYMKNYQKNKNGLYVPSSKQNKRYDYCQECGKMIEKTGNKKKYCCECALKRKKYSNKKSDKKYKNNRRENRKSSI